MYKPDSYKCLMLCPKEKAEDCINKTVNEMPDSYLRRELITSYTMHRSCTQRLNRHRTKQVQLQEEIESLKEQPKPKPKQDYYTDTNLLGIANMQYETRLENQRNSLFKQLDKIKQLSVELAEERNSINVLRTVNHNYIARIEELEKQLQNQAVSIQSLYQTIKEKDKMIQKLRGDFRAVCTFNGVIKTTNQEYLKRITELVEQVNQQPSKDIMDTVSQLEIAKAELHISYSTNIRIRKELDTVTQKLNSLNTKLLEINRLSN